MNGVVINRALNGMASLQFPKVAHHQSGVECVRMVIVELAPLLVTSLPKCACSFCVMVVLPLPVPPAIPMTIISFTFSILFLPAPAAARPEKNETGTAAALSLCGCFSAFSIVSDFYGTEVRIFMSSCQCRMGVYSKRRHGQLKQPHAGSAKRIRSGVIQISELNLYNGGQP